MYRDPLKKKNAVVGLWHYKQFPPGLWEGRRELRSSRGLQASATEALPLRVAGEMAHSRWGGAFFSLQRQSPPLSVQKFRPRALEGRHKPKRCQKTTAIPWGGKPLPSPPAARGTLSKAGTDLKEGQMPFMSDFV